MRRVEFGSALWGDDGKEGALRIVALDNPESSGDFVRLLGDPAASFFDSLDNRIGGVDVEVIEPEAAPGRRGILVIMPPMVWPSTTNI